MILILDRKLNIDIGKTFIISGRPIYVEKRKEKLTASHPSHAVVAWVRIQQFEQCNMSKEI
jgi:hypothetical protein